jgi:hypothetical protein
MDTQPNHTLRAVRMGLRMSQDDFAKALRATGTELGEPNDANKRLVQRWEGGAITAPRPVYARALEALTGVPVESLGFTVSVPGSVPPGAAASGPPDGSRDGGGRSGQDAGHVEAASTGTRPTRPGNLSGVWLSRYEYFSSGRGATFTERHFVVLLQHADRLSVRSLPASSASVLTMDLSVDGNVVTGTWVEQTDPGGYYRAARYHGAIQLLLEPTGRRMCGQWVGFGRAMEVNTGPWELVFQDASTTRATLDRYNRFPDA